MTRRVSKGGAFGARAPPLSLMPNEKSMEIKRLEGADSAKISKIFKMIFFFFCLRHSLKSTLQFGIRKNVICERKVCLSAAPPMRLLFLVQTDFSVT